MKSHNNLNVQIVILLLELNNRIESPTFFNQKTYEF